MNDAELEKQLELVQRCLAGDEGACREIFDSNYGLVMSVASRMLKNEDDARDVAQDVFSRVFQCLSRFKGDSRLSTWIRRITVNRCLDLIKAEKLSYEELPQLASSEDLESDAEKRELLGEVEEALQKLKPAQKALVLMAAHKDSDYSRLGKVFGLSSTEIRGRLYRARCQLRRYLKW
ncbi:sigma-70 family RNA polymerase sigma factor [bacterium]|jgi:RNA polymerase sigma-70 factor, ECF subfamily|nr:sigma-70 family RNA polymerase sigma factor [bacterium]